MQYFTFTFLFLPSVLFSQKLSVLYSLPSFFCENDKRILVFFESQNEYQLIQKPEKLEIETQPKKYVSSIKLGRSYDTCAFVSEKMILLIDSRNMLQLWLELQPSGELRELSRNSIIYDKLVPAEDQYGPPHPLEAKKVKEDLKSFFKENGKKKVSSFFKMEKDLFGLRLLRDQWGVISLKCPLQKSCVLQTAWDHPPNLPQFLSYKDHQYFGIRDQKLEVWVRKTHQLVRQSRTKLDVSLTEIKDVSIDPEQDRLWILFKIYNDVLNASIYGMKLPSTTL